MDNICLLMIFLWSTLPLHEMAVFHLKGATVTDGKTRLKCNFAVVYTPQAVDLRKSKIACKPKNKKPLQVTKYQINTKKPKCLITLKMTITKGKGKITHANIGMCDSLPTLKPMPTPTPMPTPMPTPTPTPISTPMPTPMPTPISTPISTPMPTPMSTPMPTPMSTPSPMSVPSPMTPSHEPSIPTLPPNPPTQCCPNISNLENLLIEMKQSTTDEREELDMKIKNLENQLSEVNKIAQHLVKFLENHIGETNCSLAMTSTPAPSSKTEANSEAFSTTSAASTTSSSSKTEVNSGAFSTTSVASTTSAIPLVTGLKCPTHWTMFGNSCYKVLDKAYYCGYLEDNKEVCLNAGKGMAHFVSINSEEENKFVLDLAQRTYAQLGWFPVRTFIGAIVDEKLPLDQRWTWLNGDRMTYSNWKDAIIPGHDEKCAFMSSYDGVWLASNGYVGGVVCKMVME